MISCMPSRNEVTQLTITGEWSTAKIHEVRKFYHCNPWSLFDVWLGEFREFMLLNPNFSQMPSPQICQIHQQSWVWTFRIWRIREWKKPFQAICIGISPHQMVKFWEFLGQRFDTFLDFPTWGMAIPVSNDCNETGPWLFNFSFFPHSKSTFLRFWSSTLTWESKTVVDSEEGVVNLVI